ncbi:MAG: hypothetical protein SOT71_09040 [Romboutsia timonensis]|uniref:hypothetical protein n=1 Tax=Romboutsia timonensis TaxID=1776391 RepID=UPI002A758EAB|nr:hypothetical protein [Romboutsia timonensis]MDY2882780.1 hypothetical protein [Romboutsia timonensis]
MNFKQYLEKYKDIINEPLKDFQIDYLDLKWNSPDEFAYSILVKIILVCINKLPLYIRVERNEFYKAAIFIGADKYFFRTNTSISYDDIDFKKLESDSNYAADLIVKCLTTSFNYKNFLEELSLKQLAKFLDMT